MKNIAIIVDSTTILDQEYLQHPNVFMTYLNIGVDNHPYVDRLELDEQQVVTALQHDRHLTSAMPSIGELLRVFNEVKEKQFEHVFVLSCSSHVSGTYAGFEMASQELAMNNLTLVDTKTIGGPVGYMVDMLLALAKQDASLDSMNQALQEAMDHTITYILPATLHNVMKSGRVNKTVGTLANLLKLKVLLVFKNKAHQIEKVDVYRTQKKALQKISEALSEFGCQSGWRIYILKCDETSPVNETLEMIQRSFEGVEVKIEQLPATLALHAGLGSITVQIVKKVN